MCRINYNKFFLSNLSIIYTYVPYLWQKVKDKAAPVHTVKANWRLEIHLHSF